MAKALIFGWLGGHKRYLRKYAPLYERALGLAGPEEVLLRPTVYATLTWSGWLRIRDEAAQYPEGYFAQVDAVHLFSGGVFAFHNFCRVRPDLRPRSVVYDSGPFLPNPGHVDHFVRDTLGLPAWVPVGDLCRALWQWEGLDSAAILAEETALVAQLRAQPLLLLNSRSDSAIPPDAAAVVTSAPGAAVRVHTWPQSKHVQHYRTFPSEYEAVLTEHYKEATSINYCGPRLDHNHARSNVGTVVPPAVGNHGRID